MKIGDAIHTGVTQITKPWTTYRRKELRDERRGARARAELMRGHVHEPSIKQIANAVMADAYLKASSGGTLPASARQIMYQARSLILDRTDKTLGIRADYRRHRPLRPLRQARDRIPLAVRGRRRFDHRPQPRRDLDRRGTGPAGRRRHAAGGSSGRRQADHRA